MALERRSIRKLFMTQLGILAAAIVSHVAGYVTVLMTPNESEDADGVGQRVLNFLSGNGFEGTILATRTTPNGIEVDFTTPGMNYVEPVTVAEVEVAQQVTESADEAPEPAPAPSSGRRRRNQQAVEA